MRDIDLLTSIGNNIVRQDLVRVRRCRGDAGVTTVKHFRASSRRT